MNREFAMHRKTNSIHKIFELRSEERSDGVAVRFKGASYSYHEINSRANFLARHLQAKGVKHGDVVAMTLPQSVEFVIAMLAILKCGAAYLPIDVSNPDSRIAHFLREASAKLLICNYPPANSHTNDLQTVLTTEKYLFDSQLKEFDSYLSNEEDLAYIMFTSGSTGKPKGVMVPHRAVIRLVIEPNYIQISELDSILQFAPPSFDASTFEFWAAFLNGATSVIYSGTGLDPNLLKSDIKDNQVTILWLTAALFHIVSDKFIDALKPLRVLLAGGDVLNPKYINKVFDEVPKMTLINGYGPTENTTFTCCHTMTVDNRPGSNVPIGKAISGTEIHILDESLKPVKRGEVGELFTSGKGVALGYLNESAHNNVFFENKSIASGTIYRTGDLVSQNEFGELEFIGRQDNQVKIRGFRVSLEEIKTHIAELKSVSDAAVITENFDSGDQLLVAYITLGENRELSARELKANLADTLPSYMIPDKIIFRSHLPINDNGKIDKKEINISISEQLVGN